MAKRRRAQLGFSRKEHRGEVPKWAQAARRDLQAAIKAFRRGDCRGALREATNARAFAQVAEDNARMSGTRRPAMLDRAKRFMERLINSPCVSRLGVVRGKR